MPTMTAEELKNKPFKLICTHLHENIYQKQGMMAQRGCLEATRVPKHHIRIGKLRHIGRA